ncbi:MAG: MotA/TolQ/ExbB proton channel family protein [Deltaproteobacteria bacterium]|nr:MotA/TolQ/ExbB proton channel family protein [Deltaproteobacteria bacterium]
MNILFLEFLVKNLGFIFTIIFLFYICLIAIRVVKLYNVLRYIDDNKKVNPSSLRFLKDQFQMLQEACKTSYNLLIENRIEQIWIEYENKIQTHFSAINGYIYSLILWGFTGTIWGTIKAFSKMGEKLFEKDLAAAEALSSALQGGLNIALYTSLVASTIGAIMVTYIYSKYMYQKAKRLEANINDEMYRIISQTDKCREANSQEAISP